MQFRSSIMQAGISFHQAMFVQCPIEVHHFWYLQKLFHKHLACEV